MKLLSFILILFFSYSSSINSQDLMQTLINPSCGIDSSSTTFCYPYFQTYFPMANDTLKCLVVFANYRDGRYDPIDQNSNLIYMQYWPGSQHLQKPSWADSVICPNTTNIWNPSLTGLFLTNSINKFWLVGRVWDSLVILDSSKNYFTRNGKNIGYAVRDVLNKIDPYVDFSEYDKFDPCDYDSDGERHEQDGVVDFIFVLFRFNMSELTDTNSFVVGEGAYTGIAQLGGYSQKFGDSTFITRDGKKISAAYPGSGCISDMYHKWFVGVPGHEFGQHYGWGGHNDGLGSHNISGFGIANAADRIHMGWTTIGNVYQPTSNTDSILLRDYVTTGDYIKINAPGKTWFIENRRRLNYYSTKNFHGWRWTLNEPLLPIQSDSGLMIYKIGGPGGVLQHAYGKWNWETCSSDTVFKITKPPYINEFLPKSVSRYTGKQIINLSGLSVKDISCNTLINQYTNQPFTKASFISANGDSNSFFDVDYNMVYSPWSNPGFEANIYDSLTIELKGRNTDGSLNVNIYFTNMTLAAPSKPQFLKVTKQMNTNPSYSFYPRLTWLRNKEPDMSTYGIYKAITNTPGEDGTYVYLASTSDTTYLDQSILMYNPNAHYNGACPPQPVCYSYRITAVDISDKESCISERDSISGYVDPCEAEEIGPDNQSIEEASNFKNDLLQNYPNPFNPSTWISYSLENEGIVNITLYDVLGRRITTLVQEFLPAGKYSFDFNANNYRLSSGIYFYIIKTKGFTKIHRMLLIK